MDALIFDCFLRQRINLSPKQTNREREREREKQGGTDTGRGTGRGKGREFLKDGWREGEQVERRVEG